MPQAIPDQKKGKQRKALGLSVRVIIRALSIFPPKEDTQSATHSLYIMPQKKHTFSNKKQYVVM